MEKALIAWLICVLGAGAIWLWAVTSVPTENRQVAGWAGGAAALAFCVASALAVYFAAKANWAGRRLAQAGSEMAGTEQELHRICEETLPGLVRRAREGAPLEAVLAETQPPAHLQLQRLLYVTASELTAAEQRTAAAVRSGAAAGQDLARFTEEILPELVRRIREENASLETAVAAVPQPDDPALGRLLEYVAQEVVAGERRGTAAMAACANAAARVQAQTTSLLAELRELQHRYGEEKVFADLLDLDHRISQLGRLADSIALLSGGRSGRRWTKPIGMESILRGAMGRINAYRRVRLHSTSDSAIVGYAAEGVMHALAELMDNATTFSAHGSEVHAYLEEEDAGIIITIEDSGLGMRKRERLRAEALVSERSDLKTLAGTRLGLAVVGRLADKYGLSVSFRPSSRGGTGVVLMIPRQLVTQPKPAPKPPREAMAPPTPEPSDPTAGVSSGTVEWTDLPKRPRGAALAAAEQNVLPVAEADAPASPRDTGARFAAFRKAAGQDTSTSQDER
ncbi:ATP-binding protein [Actinocorallia populi]|uniref:ATP-binding protein n=1 Tax=Actinocorallia populi TaxID=2079200 RepID=UPI000D087223|nr:ATP-binding protein [Actinocorallia populi]